MIISRTYKPETDDYVITVVIPGSDMATLYSRSPIAHLMNDEQARGIIEDAVLLSYGLELKK